MVKKKGIQANSIGSIVPLNAFAAPDTYNKWRTTPTLNLLNYTNYLLSKRYVAFSIIG
jgi:hypothetical protein